MADDKREGRIGELRAEGDAHRSLPRIAARLLATKELEEEALQEIEAIADGTANSFRWPYLLGGAVVVTFSVLAIVAIAVWLAASVSGVDLGYWPLVVIVPLAAFAAGPFLYWRRFQYGLGPVRKSRDLVYSGGSKATIDTLDKLFAYLARRSSPRAYYNARIGQKRYLSRQHFLGALRILLLSEVAADRAMVLPPNGLWFSRQIMIEAEPEDIIAALKVKPRSGGRPQQYDYVTILLALIEHPTTKATELSGRGDESRIMELIHTLCDPSEEHDNDIPVPEETELRKFAKRIVTAIEKNRSESKK